MKSGLDKEKLMKSSEIEDAPKMKDKDMSELKSCREQGIQVIKEDLYTSKGRRTRSVATPCRLLSSEKR